MKVKFPKVQSSILKVKLILCFSIAPIVLVAQWQGTNPVYFNAGNVGIGTTTPAAKLSFINLDASSLADGITWYNPTPLVYGIYRTAGAWSAPNYQQLKLSWNTGIILEPGSSNTKSYVDIQGGGLRVSSGNVGIGTISPIERLEVNGNINVGLNSGAATGYGNRLNLRGVDDASSGDPMWFARYNIGPNQTELRINIGDDNSGDDAFTVGNLFHVDGQWKTFLKVLNNGNIGIGTAAPSSKFEVVGPSTGTGPTILASGGGDVVLNSGGSVFFDGNYSYSSGNYIRPTAVNTQSFVTAGLERMKITSAGNVGIGTSNPNQKLTVNGTIYGSEVKVDLSVPGPDYVFNDDYNLLSLEEIKTYIDKNKHLPEVPSAKEMEANGVNLGEMNMLLLRKIEELTLFLIDQNKAISKLQAAEVSFDASAKKIEELTLYVIELKKRDDEQQKEKEYLKKQK